MVFGLGTLLGSSSPLTIARKRSPDSLAASIVNKESRTTDAAAECRRTRSNGRGLRRKTSSNFLRSYLLSLAGALFFRIFDRNDSPLFCGSQNRRPGRPGALRHGGRATGRTSGFIGRYGIPEPEACMAARILGGSFLEKKERLPQNLTYRINEHLKRYAYEMVIRV